jgi:hypothetical protein
MDYYRSGCFPGEREVPGNMMLIALMSELITPAGTPPSRLLLAQGHMQAGMMSAPGVHACELLVHLVTGSVLARVGAEEARLIADTSLRIPAATEYQFSTRDTTGMTAVVILPLQENTSGLHEKSCEARVRADGIAITGKPAVMARSSLDILRSLTPLTSEGCRLATVEMIRGSGNRNAIFAALLPQYAANPMALRAFIWACNAHPAAPWWLNRQRAQDTLVKTIEKLLTH